MLVQVTENNIYFNLTHFLEESKINLVLFQFSQTSDDIKLSLRKR